MNHLTVLDVKSPKSLTRLKLRCQQNCIYFRSSKRECCCCSVTKSCPTLCDPMDCSILGFPVLQYLPEFAQTRVCWVSDAIQPSHSLPSSSAFASILPSIQVLSNKSALCIRLPMYWSFSFSISPSNEYSELIDWFDLQTVQGTLKSLLQHHSSKLSIRLHSAFCMVQLLHQYTTTGKTIAMTIWTIVGKVTSLLYLGLSQPSF